MNGFFHSFRGIKGDFCGDVKHVGWLWKLPLAPRFQKFPKRGN
jgi:hypothetical protein